MVVSSALEHLGYKPSSKAQILCLDEETEGLENLKGSNWWLFLSELSH